MTDPEKVPPNCLAILEYLADHFGIRDLRESGLPLPSAEDLVELHHRGWLELITKEPLARITESGEDLVREYRRRRQQEKAHAEATTTTEPAGARFHSSGHFWEVAFAGKTASLADGKGMNYVAQLLAKPNPAEPIGALALRCQDESLAQVEQTFQPVLDEKAKREYGAQFQKLKDDIEEARELGNQDEQIELERQRDALAEQLESATSAYGRDRQLGSGTPARKAAGAVRKALERAYDQMVEQGLTDLADHLRQAIRPEGNAFAYRPSSPVPPWEL